MAELTVDMTYASALFQAAEESGREKNVLDDAGEILEVMKDNPELEAFVKSPAIAAEEKKEVLCNIFEGKIEQELMNFICILIDKGRIMHFDRMVRKYEEIYNTRDGSVTGVLYSVEPVSQDRLEKFQKETSKLLGENILLINEIDKTIIGVVKIIVDGRVIDDSIRSRFNRLASEIRL